MTIHTHIHRLGMLALPLALLTGACSSDPGSTSLRITAYGEEYVEDRIPAADFVDGWEVQFSRLLVAISQVEADGVPLEGSFVVDLTQGSNGAGHELGMIDVPAEGSPELAYVIAPVTTATAVSATEEDVLEMLATDASVIAEGTATKDGQTLTFRWGFGTTARYEQCEGTAALADDAQPESQLTIHADHFFYDDLDSGDPGVAFDLVASADADADGSITISELQAVDITGEARYQVGSRPITDLWSFIEAQTLTLGHIDGEGHCEQGG